MIRLQTNTCMILLLFFSFMFQQLSAQEAGGNKSLQDQIKKLKAELVDAQARIATFAADREDAAARRMSTLQAQVTIVAGSTR